MFERFANRFNTCGSCAAANESASASSFCTRANMACAENNHSGLLLTMDTVSAVSIFAVLRLIIIRLLSVIILGNSVSFSRPVWAAAQ